MILHLGMAIWIYGADEIFPTVYFYYLLFNFQSIKI